MTSDQITIVDLFSGGGGFSLGAHQAGMHVALAADVDPILSSSFRTNFPEVPLKNWDLAVAEPGWFSAVVPGRVDGIIGGPPCQAFSEIGRRSSTDHRRDLIRHFFRIVAALRPGFFVMENVRGLGFDENRGLLEDALSLVEGRYTILGPIMLHAADLGAPTNRRRLFFFGFDTSDWDVPLLADLEKIKVKSPPTVGDAIGDIITAKGRGADDHGFEWWEYDKRRKVSAFAQNARLRPSKGLGAHVEVGHFTGHTRTVHSNEVVKRFAAVAAGKQDPVGKHHRLDWYGQAPTLRAGTGSDRGSYQSVRPIHPTEARVITPREAARLQGFPDWFRFHPTVWHSFRMIGNSVSPIVSRAVLSWVAGSRLVQHVEAAE